MRAAAEIRARIDTTKPHSARFWNYFVGGKDNYEVDREIGDHIMEIFPGLVDVARTSRHFLGRSVRYLAGEQGIRQFLDIGTGLPTADNTHEVAQRVAPDARIVYVDNDPLVLTHARALLTSTDEGRTDYLDADLYAPATVLEDASETLDLSQPVALMILNTLGHVDDPVRARALVAELMSGLPSGSYLVISDCTATSPGMVAASDAYNSSGAVPYHVRPVDEIASYFDGLELVEPGIVPVTAWRPDPDEADAPAVDAYGAVGRKP
ncbi:SAM-dependent methyltransferase [Streptomyces sp. SID4919]|uniref:S-adenosyl methyltransferase n=1 Tax=Streptomyces uncialis TaxID=1048205 RepID=A0A1Q4V3C9_9ACTN|nr:MULTISPECIES: SAM-dependent methyltransferase [Streptomyces]MCX4657834.1 SAM-dependent methyltransferase [Streptomyces uncialis]MYY09739.1 SAM-dependent methyltransferase [Streptomyces sp. SID4919]OKH92220.1 S-adenosyl methyltransferase [Streptomyces uncialis]WST66180.1 SAM-dependent methyltransferase [Streptomyces uncialis]WTE15191.1 SAM-dependent methyltransferase [Streptomyces uncialis]